MYWLVQVVLGCIVDVEVARACVSWWNLFFVCFLGWFWLWPEVVLEAEAVRSTTVLMHVVYEEAVGGWGAASSCTYVCRTSVVRR